MTIRHENMYEPEPELENLYKEKDELVKANRIYKWQDENKFFDELLSGGYTNTEVAKSITEYLVHTIMREYRYSKNNYSVEEQEKALNKTTKDRVDFLNHKFKDDSGKSSNINDFFISLFERYGTYNSKSVQLISLLDYTRFVVKVSNGSPIIRRVQPLDWIATKLGIPDSDIKEEDRKRKRKKRKWSMLSLDSNNEALKEEVDKKAAVNIEEQVLKFDDERLSNYIYLTDEQKYIFGLIYKGFKKVEIQKILELTPSKLNTQIKNIAKQLSKPVKVENVEKPCCVCGKTKLISEFTKDKSKKDGYSPRCKQCDKERKQKNKNDSVGKVKKMA